MNEVKVGLIETAKGRIEYGEVGGGFPILYFHGTGAGNDLVFAIEAALLGTEFRLLVPNRPGYGRTPLSSGPSCAECVDLAAALLEHLGLDRVAVMGYSGGGLFAAKFAERYPAQTVCLILGCAQTHRWDSPTWLPIHSRLTYPLLARPVWRRMLLWGYRLQLNFTSAKALLKLEAGARFEDVRSDPEAIDFARRTLGSMKCCQARPAGFENDFQILLTEPLLQPGTVMCPTLVIHDPLDPMAPVQHRDWTLSCIPHANRCDVHAGGHLVWIGAEADLVQRRRVEFLRRTIRDDRMAMNPEAAASLAIRIGPL
jgi:pimeloyl-ACP methyl ester carboxylesterase